MRLIDLRGCQIWNQWITDETHANYISKEGSVGPNITYNELDSAIKIRTLQNEFSTELMNTIGVYFHQKKVNKQKVYFYYVSSNVNKMPKPSSVKEWSKQWNGSEGQNVI